MADKTTVPPMDPAKKNSPMIKPSDGASTMKLDSTATECEWNGQSFADGAMVECDGVVFECSFGHWIKN